MKFKSRVGLNVLLLAAVAFAGCNQTPRSARRAFNDYQVGNFAQAAALLRPAAERRDEHYVLNNCRLGSAALAAGNLQEAQEAFMRAYEIMNSVKINDPGRQLGTAMVFEGVKVWKGEPFEQAMAHYYLGMIFLLQNDYDNARAAFENSLFKVREYAKKDDLENYSLVESRFALGYFGLGFCNLRMNKPELAQANFELARRYDSRLSTLIADVQRPGVNALIFIDAGRGPQKEGKGWYNEESAFKPTPAEAGPVPVVRAFVDGRAITRQAAYDTVDTLAMAQDQRWQDIDTIKKVKAAIGTGAMAAGAGMTAYGAHESDEGLMWAGVGTMVLGAALAASSQSDVRYWEMLPRTVYIVPAILEPGPRTIEVEAGRSRSAPLQITIAAPAAGAPRDHIFYFRLR